MKSNKRKINIFNSLIISGCIICLITCMLGCSKEKGLEENKGDYEAAKNISEHFVSTQTDSKILKGYGIDSYQIHSPDASQLNISFKNGVEENDISYKVNPETRVRVYSFSNSQVEFTIRFDERAKVLSLVSSLNDKVEAVVRGAYFVDKATGKELDSKWFTKLNFNYELIIKMMEMVQEMEMKKQFVSSIEIMDKKVNDAIMIKKVAARKKPMFKTLYQPCSTGNDNCVSDSYGGSRSIACSNTNASLAVECSNAYCIGYCEDLGCDCVCAFGDFLCVCTSKGRYCTGYRE